MRQVISFNNKNFPLFVPTPAEDPQFRFEANAASTVTFKQSNTSFSALQYKINGGSWNNFDLTTNVTNTVNLAQGDKMYVRGKRNQTGNGANFRATAGDISLKGDIRYLDDFETQLEATSMRFTFMFHSFFATGDAQSYITDVSGLKIPYTSYNGFAFSNLFDYCTRLTGAAPDLLASYIPGDYCCCLMFRGTAINSLKLYATSKQGSTSLIEMFNDVTSTGILYVNPSAPWTSSDYTNMMLPNTWTVQNI